MSEGTANVQNDPVDILLVDDQPARLLAYRAILAPLAENLIEANSGAEALRHLMERECALILLDAIVRILPGVMGNDLSGLHESFEGGLLEHPHYTRPQIWEGREIPAVLTSGNHAAIARWQREQAEQLTRERRPDLLEKQSKK